ncbi:MAG: hypothetical protein HLUCCA04_11885 [Oceanicaulis sp. HLUCCA04]|nr:MAG: hypothetical protein HLUCCA04_11885 [Oceanicaulis sp. HLUCCA04]
MSQNAKDDMPGPRDGTIDRAKAGQTARRRVLGDQLRAYYDSVTSEPVPSALSDLMTELARKSATTGNADRADTADAAKRDGNGQDSE